MACEPAAGAGGLAPWRAAVALALTLASAPFMLGADGGCGSRVGLGDDVCIEGGVPHAVGDEFLGGPGGCQPCVCSTGGAVLCVPEPCEEKPEISCGYDGATVALGQTFVASDGCNVCRCGEPGLVVCSEAPLGGGCPSSCEAHGVYFFPGETVLESEGCTCVCGTSSATLECAGPTCGDGCIHGGELRALGSTFAATDAPCECRTCQCLGGGEVHCEPGLCPEPGDTFVPLADPPEVAPGQVSLCQCGAERASRACLECQLVYDNGPTGCTATTTCAGHEVHAECTASLCQCSRDGAPAGTCALSNGDRCEAGACCAVLLFEDL